MISTPAYGRDRGRLTASTSRFGKVDARMEPLSRDQGRLQIRRIDGIARLQAPGDQVRCQIILALSRLSRSSTSARMFTIFSSTRASRTRASTASALATAAATRSSFVFSGFTYCLRATGRGTIPAVAVASRRRHPVHVLAQSRAGGGRCLS